MSTETPKRKPGRPKPRQRRKVGLKSLEQLALDHGYMPGEFQMLRMLEGMAKIQEWDSYLTRGVCPPDFNSIDKANLVRGKMASAIAEEERELLAYFHPKKKQSDVSANITGELTLLDLLKRAS